MMILFFNTYLDMSRIIANNEILVRRIPINSEILPLVSMQLYAVACFAMHKKEKEREKEKENERENENERERERE